jgi:hypothetical protein
MPKTIACPNCGKPVSWTQESRWRPFCSERCRLIDLGEWFDGGHRISEPADEGFPGPEAGGESGRH